MAPLAPDLLRRIPWAGQFLRYVLVGGVAFGVDFGVLLGLTELAGWHYRVAAATGFMTGLIVNYVLATRFVFDERRLGSRLAEFAVYVVIGLIGVGLNDAILYTFAELLRVHYTIGKVVSAAVVLVFNFTSRKLLLFTR